MSWTSYKKELLILAASYLKYFKNPWQAKASSANEPILEEKYKTMSTHIKSHAKNEIYKSINDMSI